MIHRLSSAGFLALTILGTAAAQPTITTTSLPNATAGASYSQNLQVQGGRAPYTWSISTGALPSSLSLSSSGTISGTPASPGTSKFTVQVNDRQGNSDTQALSLTTDPAPLVVTTASLANATAGTAYSQSLAATGGTGGYTWSVTSGSLPNGLSLASGGTISGTPTAAGSSTITFQVTDSSGTKASKALGLTVNPAPLTITTSSLPNGTVGSTYSQALAAAGGTGSYTWSVINGSLPGGLSLSSGGSITGTPTATGTSNFTAQVKDSSGATNSKALTLTINPPPLTVTTASLPAGTVGSAYLQTLSASGGTGGYTWSIASGSLPAGLSLNGATISGTPSAAGTAAFTAQVRDSAGSTASKSLSITVNPPPLTVTTASLPSGMVGSPYSQALAASGGTGTYTWSIVSGSLPAGLSLNGATISGTPSAAATSGFTVQVADGAGTTASKPLSITVAPAPLTVTTASLPNGMVGSPYSQTLSASGGTGTYTWSIVSGSLPAGLSLNGATIAGTPSTAGSSGFTVQVADTPGATASRQLSISIVPPALTVTTTSLPNGMAGSPYSQSLAASGGTGSYTWSITSGSLPAGLSLNGATIAGTASTAGTSGFTVQVADASGATASKSLSLTIVPPTLSVATASLPIGTVGTAYSQGLAATGGTGSYSWSILSGSLPPGLSLNGATISGAPTTAGTSGFTVQVADASGATASRQLSISIIPPTLTVTTASLPNGMVGSPYSQGLAASGGTGSYTWSITTGSLPAGLSLNGATISGTASAAGTSAFTVQVADVSGTTASKTLSLTIVPPTLSVATASLPIGTVGTAYSQALAATGGTGTYTWSILSGSLPAGLSLNGATISGTPTTAGTSGFTVQVADASGATASRQLSLSIIPPTLTVTTASLPNGMVGSPYSQALAASGGTGPYTWSITSGSLPAGLSLNGATIAGTPSTAGVSGFTVQVADTSGTTLSRQLSLTVSPPTLTVTIGSLPNGIVGTAYSQALSASGGSSPYSWSVSFGSLPAGLSLNGATIAGTPSAAGTSGFTVQVADATGATASRPMSVTINAAALTITTASILPNGAVGTAYSQPVAASGGSGAYTWTLISGSLPPGLSLNGATISGKPTAAGAFGFTLQVSDATGATSVKQFAITVAGGALVITTTSLNDATLGVAYTQTIVVTGGTNLYSWSITSGQLPPGLVLASNGVIAGTPSAGGAYNFTVQVTDSSSAHTSASFTLTVRVPLTIVTQTVLATGSAGHAYSQSLVSQGGSGTVSWSLVSGSLPAGLTLHPNGVIDGVPAQVGSFSITIQAADASGATVSRAFTLSIVSGLTISTPPILPGATVSAPYSVTLQPAGGTAPYTWSVISGSLPAGLTFGANGTISGTPGTAGAFTFTAQITDANSNQASKQFSLTVASALVITTGPTLPNGSSSAPYQAILAATGGNPPYLWSVTAGGLPAGLSLDGSGTISGTPSAAGAFTFTATVTDSANIAAQRQFTIAIGQGLTITSAASLPNATAGTPYSVTLAASGGQAPYSWNVTGGSLPPGLALNAATGAIAGTPSAAGVFNFTVQVTDSSKLAAAGVLTIAVGLPSLPALSLNGLPANAAPLQQPSLDVALSSPYPVDITGVLTLTFTPAGANPANDPSVQFSTGGRTVNFTIPANTSHALFAGSSLALQTGSVAGTITVAVESLQSGGNSLAVPPGLSESTQVTAAAPIIESVSLVSTSGGFQVQIVALSTTREVTQAVISFSPSAGSSLQTGQLTIPLTTSSQSWFQSTDSQPFGGQFTLTLPFTVQGGSNVVGSVSVVLSNTAGDSPAASGS